METVNERLAAFVEYIGQKQSNGKGVPEVARTARIETNTLRIALRAGASKPSFDTLSAILAGYSNLSPDWLMLGNGPMLRDGRTLTPVVKEETSAAMEPAADYTSGEATTQTLYISVLKEQVADLKEDKTRLIEENKELRKKSSDSPDAAGTTPAPTTPKKPTPGCGFMTAARREQLAAEFNRFLEEQEQVVEAAELS